MTSNWIVWMLSISVLLLLVKALLLLMNPLRLLIAGNRVNGTIIGMTEITASADDNHQGTCQSPTLEFYTKTGNKVTIAGKFNCGAPTPRLGDVVTLAYHKSRPDSAKILSWSEIPFVPAVVCLGIAFSIILIWVSFILIFNDYTFDDPLHLFSDLIFRYELNPVRFPVLFILSFLGPGCLIYSYVLADEAFKIRSNGTRVSGRAVDYDEEFEFLHDRGKVSASFIYVMFVAESGAHVITRRSLIRPFTRLKPGDAVEVIYPQRQPHKCIVNVWDELYLNAIIFGLLALGFLTMFYWVLNVKPL